MHLPNAAVAAEQKQAWQVISGRRTLPRRAAPRAWYMALGGLVVATLVLYVHTVSVEAHLIKQQTDLHKAEASVKEKRCELAQIQNPLRVEALASQHLGMVQPKEVVFMAKPGQLPATRSNVIPPPTAVIHEGF